MSKTNYLQAVISDLQRTAGPYRCARSGCEQSQQAAYLFNHLVGARLQRYRHDNPKSLGSLEIDDQIELRRLYDW